MELEQWDSISAFPIKDMNKAESVCIMYKLLLVLIWLLVYLKQLLALLSVSSQAKIRYPTYVWRSSLTKEDYISINYWEGI